MKIKNRLKKATACFLVVVLLLTSAPLSGFVGLDFSAITKYFSTFAAATDNNFDYYIYDDEACVKRYNFRNSDGNVVIPEMLGGYPVTEIGPSAFKNSTVLRSITIPDGVTKIEFNAFSGCTNLESVSIPDSVTSIGSGAFSGCLSLKSITIPDGVTEIEASTFSGCFALTDVKISYRVTSIGSGAFGSCNFESITLPEDLASIGDYAFENCKRLKKIIIPQDVTEIKKGTFNGCTSLADVEISSDAEKIGESAFYYCTALTEITIPDSVKSVGDSAFSGCTGLAEITLGKGVERVGKSAFKNCTGLKKLNWNARKAKNSDYGYFFENVFCYAGEKTAGIEVIFGNSVEIVPYGAFYKASKLKSVEFKNAVAQISEAAFFGCTGLTDVTIPDSVKSVGASAFSGCTGLTEITLGKGIKGVGESAFENCTGLEKINWNAESAENFGSRYDCVNNVFKNAGAKSGGIDVVFGNDVKEIPGGMFYNVPKIKTVKFGKRTTEIRDSAFFGCTGLSSVTIPDNIKTIGESAFSGCTGLKSITLGRNVTRISWFAFENCTGLEKINWDAKNVERFALGYYNYNSVFKNAGEKGGGIDVVFGNNVKKIPNEVFYNVSKIKSVKLGTRITEISNSAFSGCTGLTSIEIPESIGSIGEFAFSGCSGLKGITIPDSITSIENGTFKNCSGLTSIEIPESVGSIGEFAFSGCSGLNGITIPGSITSIENGTFENCSSLTNIEIPESIGSIGEFAFSGCSGLKGITIPDSITSIENGTFKNCFGLTSIEIPESVGGIGEFAFSGCNGLKGITIPDSVKRIESEAFKDCTGLESVSVSGGVKSIQKSTFEGCTRLKNITIPNSVTSIEKAAFKDCSALSSIAIPSSVASIGEGAFKNCTGLKSMEFSSGVKSIGSYALQNCSALETLEIPVNVTDIGDYAFSGCTGLKKINWNAQAVNNFEKRNYVFTEAGSKADGIDVVFSNSVKRIPDYAFYGEAKYNATKYVKPYIKSITFGENVKTIGNNMLKDCAFLERINWNAVNADDYSYAYSGGLFSGSGAEVPEINIAFGNNVKRIPEGLFGKMSKLLSVEIGGATRIGVSAFSECPNLTSVVVLGNISEIGDRAFYGCGKLEKLTINDGVKSIGSSAFENCGKLADITVPDSVISIGDDAFQLTQWENNLPQSGDVYLGLVYYCRKGGVPKNGSIAIKDGTKGIADCAFNKMTKLKSITIPNSVTHIGDYAFFGCTGLTGVKIPYGVKNIGSFAFGNCNGLTEIALPGSVEVLSSAAFSACKSLKRVSLSGNLTEICGNTFSGCSSLESMAIPNGVSRIGEYAFWDCSGLRYVSLPSSVKEIGAHAFKNCTGLTRITIPSSVSSLGDYAFSDCTNLESITISAATTKIGNSVFNNTKWYNSKQNGDVYVGDTYYRYKGDMPKNTEVVIAEGTKVIANDAFSHCSNLKKITIPNSVTTIGEDAFLSCTGLTELTIPDSVTSIGATAFWNCSGLKSLSIGKGLLTVGSGAFRNCSALETVNWNAESAADLNESVHVFSGSGKIPEGMNVVFGNDVLKIPAHLFNSSLNEYNKAAVGSVTLGSGIETIGKGAFSSCTDLKTINWNAKAAKDFKSGESAFESIGNENGPVQVIFGDEVEIIPAHAFSGCANLGEITLGSGVKKIGNSSFSDCTGLSKINWNAKAVEDFESGNAAFLNTGEVELVFGSGVERIPAYAFFGASGVSAVTLPDSVVSVGKKAFDSTQWYASQPGGDVYLGSFYYGYKGSMPEKHTVSINENATAMVDFALSGCANLSAVVVPEGMTNIGDSTFRDCANLERIEWNAKSCDFKENNFVFSNAGTNVEVVFGGEVESVPENMFSGSSESYKRPKITSVVLGDGITKIGAETFKNYDKLKRITIGKNVAEIAGAALENCTALETINWNAESVADFSSNGSILGNAGKKVKSLEVLFGESVKRIPAYAFSGATGVEYVEIKNGVTSIGNYAFLGCTGLVNIAIPDSVTSIGFGAFSGCTGLTKIVIPNGVTVINPKTFSDCTGLKSVVIGDSVTEIGESAFRNCTSLTTVYCGKKLVKIGVGAFRDCEKLEKIYLPKSLKIIENEAFLWRNNFIKTTAHYAGSSGDWKGVRLGKNTGFTGLFKIISLRYNSGYNGGNSNSNYSTGSLGTSYYRFTPRKKSTAAGNAGEKISDLTENVNQIIENAKAKTASKEFEVSGRQIQIPYDDGRSGFVISAEGYNKYIIPQVVARNALKATDDQGDYNETVYLSEKEADKKPYVSSVYVNVNKSGEYSQAFSNLVDGAVYVFNGSEKYDIIVSAADIDDNVISKGATYYIGQIDQNGETGKAISSETGFFKGVSLEEFDKGKPIYSWVKFNEAESKPCRLKAKIFDINENEFYKSLIKDDGSADNFPVVDNNISVAFPKDWMLVGKKVFDIAVNKNCSAQVSFDPAEGKLKVAVGAEKYFGKKFDPTVNKQTWESFKDFAGYLANEAKSKKNGTLDSFVRKYCQSNKMLPTVVTPSKFVETKFGLGGNVVLALEYHIDDKQVKLISGTGALGVEFKAAFDGQIQCFVYGISGGAKSTVSLSAEKDQSVSGKSPVSWDASISLTPYLRGYLGVGLQNVASASIYGQAEFPIAWNIRNKTISFRLYGEIGIQANVLVFSASLPILSSDEIFFKTFSYGKGASKIPARSARLVQNNDEEILSVPDFEPKSREYAKNTSEWLGGSNGVKNGPMKIKASSRTENGVKIKNLRTSVYGSSNAKVITGGGKTIAVWIEDDAARDEYNRTKLVYSVYNANADTWSEPKAVYDDGFVDANPFLATDGTEIYVAWQKSLRKFDKENSKKEKDILSAGEIFLAKFDKEKSSFIEATRLTEDSVYDYNPVVSVKDGKPVVYYCTSANNSMTEIDGNKISRFANGKTEVIKNNLSTVYSLTVCEDEIAYSVDTDGKIDTLGDIKTFFGKADSKEAFTEFKIESESPKLNFAYGKLGGKNMLFVSDGANIYYLENGKAKAILEEDTVITGQINVVSTMDSDGAQEGLSIFWTQENDVGNEILTCSYANGKWSGATQSTNRKNRFTDISITAATNGKIIGMCNETLRELDESKNYYVDKTSNFISFTANDYSDLALSDVYLDESEFAAGKTLKLFATVENNGNVAAESFVLTVSDQYQTSTKTVVEKPLESGKKETYELEYTVPESFESGDIEVKVEIENDVDEADNSFKFSVNKPGLKIMKSSVSNNGSLYTVDAVVCNTKFTTAKNVTFKSYIGEATGEPFDSIQLDSVSRESPINVQLMFTEEDIKTEAGHKSITLVAEDEDGNSAQLEIFLNELEVSCGHEKTQKISGKAASCTQGGLSEGEKCLLCGVVTKQQVEIPALGHTEKLTKGKKPTCTQNGLTSKKKCSVCGLVLEEGKVIQKTGHKEEVIKGRSVDSCRENGLTEGKRCSVCKVVLEKRRIIKKAEHKLEKVVIAPTCYIKGYSKNVCSVCGYDDYMWYDYVPATGHIDSNNDNRCDSCGKRMTNNGVLICICACHSEGFRKFIFNFKLFFQKIFKKNKTCKCGDPHY